MDEIDEKEGEIFDKVERKSKEQRGDSNGVKKIGGYGTKTEDKG